AEWVENHLHDPKVRLIEVDVDTSAYDQGHIPGAVGFNWQKELQDQVIRAPLSQAHLEDLLSRAGVSNDTTIVLYGDNNNWFAAWALWILKYYGHPDVRSPAEYSGELLAPANLPQEGAQRGGHIPGAANIPWSMAVREDGTFKPADELRALYASKGVTPDKNVVAYCRIGERSSHTWYVLNYLLGYPHVRNYDGSWTEWGSLIGAPIEKSA